MGRDSDSVNLLALRLQVMPKASVGGGEGASTGNVNGRGNGLKADLTLVPELQTKVDAYPGMEPDPPEVPSGSSIRTSSPQPTNPLGDPYSLPKHFSWPAAAVHRSVPGPNTSGSLAMTPTDAAAAAHQLAYLWCMFEGGGGGGGGAGGSATIAESSEAQPDLTTGLSPQQ